MYDDTLHRIPTNEQDMWSLMGAQFEHIAADFDRPHLESREDALTNRHHDHDRRDGMNVVRYRDVSIELDSRPHFWGMGKSLIEDVGRLLSEGQLTPALAQQWGKLQFCHGYIMAHVFDDSDDLTYSRAGKQGAAGRTKDAERQWVAHLINILLSMGRKRNAVEDDVVAYINRAIAEPQLRGGFSVSWFRNILQDHARLKTTYDEQRLTKMTIRQLVRTELVDLPPIPSKLP